jgi:hypothetical protein
LLCSEFKLLNYTISGSSSTKRHIVSPAEQKIVTFNNCIDEFSSLTIADSFHVDRYSIKSTHTIVDFKSKDPKFLKAFEEERKNRLIKILKSKNINSDKEIDNKNENLNKNEKDEYLIKHSFTPLDKIAYRTFTSTDNTIDNDKSSSIISLINYLHHKNTGIEKDRAHPPQRFRKYKYNEGDKGKFNYKNIREYSTNTSNLDKQLSFNKNIIENNSIDNLNFVLNDYKNLITINLRNIHIMQVIKTKKYNVSNKILTRAYTTIKNGNDKDKISVEQDSNNKP